MNMNVFAGSLLKTVALAGLLLAGAAQAMPTWATLNTTAHPVAWQHCAIAKYDAAQLGTAEKDALALVADASNYPLVFHCMCGQDRTGCLAIYIYSILGVDDETMLKSWEA